MEGITVSGRTKIRLKETHVAYVNSNLLHTFQSLCRVTSYLSWVEEMIYTDFKLRINCPGDIAALQKLVREAYYDSIGEWLQEKMRNTLKTVK